MKKLLIVLTLLLAVLSAEVAGAEEFKLRFATIAPADSPWHKSLKYWVKDVEKRTNGRVKVVLFMGGQLGGEHEMVESVKSGAIEAAGISTGTLAAQIPEFQLFELPFMWDSREQAHFVLDNYLKEPFGDKMKRKGFVMVGWSENGWRNFHTRDKLIKTAADLKGLKFRSQENKVHQALWKALGATGTPIGMTGVSNALQRGLVDGGENTIVLTMATGWFEFVNNITITEHIYQPAVVFIGRRFWKSLPKDIQDAMLATMKELEMKTRKSLHDEEKKGLALLKSMNKKVYTPTKAERQTFIDAVKGLKKQFAGTIGKDLLNLVDKGKAAYK